MELHLYLIVLIAAIFSLAASFNHKNRLLLLRNRNHIQNFPNKSKNRFSCSRLHAEKDSQDGSNNDESEKGINRTQDYSTYGKPQIIPFDFAREDIIPPALKEEMAKYRSKATTSTVAPPSINKSTQPKSKTASRPSGYDNEDINDVDPNDIDGEDPNWLPRDTSTANPLVNFLKDVYIGSPYDSRNKQQARYVVRNVTAISVAIGLVFTFIWYAFPGKFISFKGQRDGVSNAAILNKVDPNELLRNDMLSSPGFEYFHFDDDVSDRQSQAPVPLPNDRDVISTPTYSQDF